MRSSVFHFLIGMLILFIGAAHWVQRGIHEIFVLFSSDGVVSQNLIVTIYFFLLFDIALMAGVIFSKKVFAQDRILKILFLVEFFLAQLIFLDRSGIQQEAHSITFFTALQLACAGLVGLALGYRYFCIKKDTIMPSSFWILFGLGMIYGAMDEWIMIHEPLGAVVLNIPLLGGIASILTNPDDLIIIGYVLLALAFVVVYFRHIKSSYPVKIWVYIILGVVFQALAELSEFAYLLYTEEYLELFASFMYMLFAVSAFIAFKQASNQKKKVT